MYLVTFLAFSLAAEAPPTLQMTPLGERIAVSGPSWAMSRLLEGRPALQAEGAEIALQLVERATDGREPLVAIYAPSAPLARGTTYTLKSWPGTEVVRGEPRAAAPAWNGTIEVLETAAGVTLRFSPRGDASLVRVVAGGQLSLIPLAGDTVRVDVPRGRKIAVTATLLDASGRESAPRSFEVVTPRKHRAGCRASSAGASWRVASAPAPAPAPWSAWQRLLAFGLLPFAAGYGGVALAIRRRRRRVVIIRP